MVDNRPTLHHLNCSQSQRILWLLEELNVDYDLVLHERNPPNHPKAPFRSPEKLLAVGYGKAPVLITGVKDGSRTIPESSAIATYLIRTFDTEDKFGLRNGDWIRDEIITSILSTNFWGAVAMFLDIGVLQPGDGPAGDMVRHNKIWGALDDLERELKTGPKGGYFMGEHPGRADILAEYRLSAIKQRSWVDLKKDYPLLDAWLERVYARPAWKRGLEKGNGYDLNQIPKVPSRQ